MNVEPENVKPTVSYALYNTTSKESVALTDGMYTNDNSSETDIILTLTHPIYASSTGAAFTDSDDADNDPTTDIADAVALKKDGTAIEGSDLGVGIAGTVVTLNPASGLADGLYTIGLEAGEWYYGNNNTKMEGDEIKISFTVDATPPEVPSALALGDGLRTTDNDPTPDIVVTAAETGGTMQLYFDDSAAGTNHNCDTAASAAIPVTAATAPFTVTITANANALGQDSAADDPYEFYAMQTDLAGNKSQCSTLKVDYYLDATAPEVLESSTEYYSEREADKTFDTANEMEETYRVGTTAEPVNIYTKIVFSEEVLITQANNKNARPSLTYDISGVTVQYDITTSGSTLASEDCQPINPSTGTNNTEVSASEFHCLYTVASGDNGDFRIIAGTATQDRYDNNLKEEYQHKKVLTLDNTVPTVVSTEYRNAPSGGKKIRSVEPGEEIYSIVRFSEAVQHKAGSGADANPMIKAKAMKGAVPTVSEFQYRIVGPTKSIRSGDCRPDSTNNIYTCRYTANRVLTGSNIFKTFATAYEDVAVTTQAAPTGTAGNSGTAQKYDTVVTSVNIDPNATEVPTVSFAPADGSTTSDVAGDVRITISAPIFTDANGTKFSNVTIDNIITLNVNGANITVPGDNITIANNDNDTVVTIDPAADFSDGDRVIATVSGDWYYGVCTPKTTGCSGSQGVAAAGTFRVDNSKPTVRSVAYRDAESGGSTLRSVSARGRYTPLSRLMRRCGRLSATARRRDRIYCIATRRRFSTAATGILI